MQGLGEPGDADQERVAAGQQRGEHAVHHLVLAHDALGDLGAEAGDRLGEALELLDIVVRRRSG